MPKRIHQPRNAKKIGHVPMAVKIPKRPVSPHPRLGCGEKIPTPRGRSPGQRVAHGVLTGEVNCTEGCAMSQPWKRARVEAHGRRPADLSEGLFRPASALAETP